MPQAFISYADENQNLAGILRALLGFHGVTAWCAPYDIRGGTEFCNEISEALSKSELLIAMVSQYSAKSEWVSEEIAAFRNAKPKSPIVPVALDSTDPNEVHEGLANYQGLVYDVDGFERLFQIFGRKFLKSGYSPEKQNGDRRIGVSERRTLDLRRYRTGLWKYFKETNDATSDAKMDISLKTIQEVATTLRPEVGRFQYRDRDTREMRDSHKVITEALDLAWQQLRSQQFASVLLVTDALAEAIWDSNEVLPIDRRLGPERRKAHGRAVAIPSANGIPLDAKKASA